MVMSELYGARLMGLLLENGFYGQHNKNGYGSTVQKKSNICYSPPYCPTKLKQMQVTTSPTKKEEQDSQLFASQRSYQILIWSSTKV